MVSTDPIADMLTRVRNAIAVRKADVSVPHSNIKESIAKLLMDNKYIQNVKVVDGATSKSLLLTLNDGVSNQTITEIVRLSKPGRRMYTSSDEIPHVKQGRGIVIISTSKGLMTGQDAKKAGLGGELICKVY